VGPIFLVCRAERQLISMHFCDCHETHISVPGFRSADQDGQMIDYKHCDVRMGLGWYSGSMSALVESDPGLIPGRGKMLLLE
jgi:hypothetical protein